ncbi:ornithine carbamoyltransferase [Streptomyces sp. CA-132043]|uniref:ornithine carbamoyltransferase n=1 Tax=Streptomyces sp. CA-132043 TaxID=3240048 RepID=UPI003D94DE38
MTDATALSTALATESLAREEGSGAPKHLLRVNDLTFEVLAGLLALARKMKQEPREWSQSLQGAVLGCVFEKPSTRTRVSLATAAHRLGMTAIVLNRQEMQLGHGESLEDTTRVLSSYLDAISVRTFEHSIVERVAAVSGIPVINALTNTHHPCQSLADLLTLQEHFGSLSGLRATYLGDGKSNTCNSFLEACAATGMHVTLASPLGYETDEEVLADARRVMADTGGSVTLSSDPPSAVREAQAVYAEIWAPMDKKEEHAQRAEDLAAYRVDGALLSHAAPDTMVLHCLPAVRGEEITSEVLDGPQSLVWRQAANRLPTTQALLHTLVGADG